MAIEVEFGALLRQARRLAGLQQIDVAHRAQIRQADISLIERGRGRATGRANPTLATLEALAAAVGFDLLLVLLPQSPPRDGADTESVKAMVETLQTAVDRLNSAIAMLRGSSPTSTRRRKRKV